MIRRRQRFGSEDRNFEGRHARHRHEEQEERPRHSRREAMQIDPEETTVSGVNVKAVQKRIDEMSSGFLKLEANDPKELRILPPQPCMSGDFVFAQTIHFGLEDDEGRRRAVACLRALDEDCPLCNLVDELYASGRKEDKKLADDMRAQQQLLAEVLVRPSKRVRIFRMPVGVYRTLASSLASPRIGDFTNKDTGRDILITRTGTGKYDTRYSAQFLDPAPIGTKKWKTKRVNFKRLAAPVLKAKTMARMIEKQYG